MDSQNADRIDACYRLMAACARARAHPLMDGEVRRQLAAFDAWQELPGQAELHGMAPLLRHHLKRIGAVIPDEAKRVLDGLYLRHRALNRSRAQVLLEVTELLEKAGIRAHVLKGLALAYEYYPDPALRPTSDIDLLLDSADMLRALELLNKSGYRTNTPPADRKLLPKELTLSAPPTNGVTTSIELHHHDPRNRSVVDGSFDTEFAGFEAQPHLVKIVEGHIYVPDPMDTLEYLFRHLQRHMFVANQKSPLPLRWLADIVNLVEHHAETVDWAEKFVKDPALKHRLEVIYSLTPFPEALQKFIPIRKIPAPRGVNRYPQGWPQQVHSEWKRAGLWIYFTKTLGSPRYIWNTLSVPSDWWLQLQYGADAASVFWAGRARYRLQVLRMAIAKTL